MPGKCASVVMYVPENFVIFFINFLFKLECKTLQAQTCVFSFN